MDYEKKYKESLAVAKEILNSRCKEGEQGAFHRADLETIFPELAESEDEKIRKVLIDYFKGYKEHEECGIRTFYGIPTNDFLTWLEKQGEQKHTDKVESMEHSYITTNSEFFQWIYDRLKYVYNENPNVDYMLSLKERIEDMKNPTDKIEPKFKAGDWIVNNKYNDIVKVLEINNEQYRLDYCDTIGTVSVELIDNDYHLWTIQDAKAGDVLQLGEVTAIFKECIGNEHCICYCSFCEDEGFEIPSQDGYDNSYGCYNAAPASKEQRELLFQQMKEAGYEWDADKKELKKINSYCQENCKGYQETGKCFFDEECQAKKAAEKKELKKIHNALAECEIEHIEHGKYYYCIKDYFAGGKKQASKGDVVQALRGLPIMGLGVKANKYFLPVNSIKQEPAWSEEDEKIRKHLLGFIVRFPEDSMAFTGEVKKKDILAWLEKQKDKELPEVIDRETIDEYAYQCAYDLSHDWIKDTPTWDDVESACKLGAKWQENHSKDNMVEALRTEYEKGKADTLMSQKWNEEDEKTLSRIRAIVRNDNSSRVEDILWLKSLKERIKPQWKPSDYQLEALESVIENCAYSEYQDCLRDLLTQLKIY